MHLRLLFKKSSILSNLILLLLTVGIVFAVLLLGNNFFEIKTIEIRGQEKISLKGLDSIYKTNIFFLDERKIIPILYEFNSELTKINITKEYPQKLIIYVDVQDPIASLKTNNGFFLLGEDGRIISKVKNNLKRLPTVNYYQQIDFSSYNSGQTISFIDLKSGLNYLSKGLALGLSINTLDIKGEDMIALKLNDKEIIFSLAKEKNSQLYQFETIIKQFKIAGRDFKKIDFRFDKPIVTF